MEKRTVVYANSELIAELKNIASVRKIPVIVKLITSITAFAKQKKNV